MRYVDFNIYVNIINDSTPGVIACTVEVKSFPFDKIAAGMTVVEAIQQTMKDMLPQVIQQVQFAFHQFSGLQEMHALLFVGLYCKFLRFKRSKVPPLPDIDDIPENGFKFDETEQHRKMKDLAEPGTRDHWFRLFAGDDYHPAFKRGMNRVVRFAANIPLPQQQE